MARATTPTLIPLDRVAEVTGIFPMHFDGVISQVAHLEPYCEDIWFQHPWQNVSKYSYEELARDLNAAEEITAKYLGYWPSPKWITGEEHLLPQHNQIELSATYNARGMRKSILSRWGHVLEGGIRATSLIQEDAPVVYSDSDADGYSETATVTVNTTVTDIEEIRVFYPNENAAVEWEIRPVDVTIAAGIATITFQKSQAVLPALLERLPAPNDPLDAVNGDDDTNFLRVVDVYRVYNDPSQQVIFYAEPDVAGGNVGTTYTGYIVLRDQRRGILGYASGTYDPTTTQYASTEMCEIPLRAKFWYRAGLQNPNSSYPKLRMTYELERLIIYYALSLSDKEICGCDNFQSYLSKMREDLAMTGDRRSFQVTERQLENPLGTTRAAQQLWNYINQHRLGSTLRKGG